MKDTLIRNLWYVAGSSDEFPTGKLVGQTIVGLPLVMWRPEDGEVIAFDGRCCHKKMPLASGKLLADGTLECAYHGLCFDTAGKCVKIPSQPGRPIPSRAKLRPYPIVEQDGIVWIWMGDEANPELQPPRIPELDSAHWEMIRVQNVEVPTNYLLLIENLLDISHFYPLHDGNIGDIANSEIPVEFVHEPIQGNRSVASIRKAESYRHPPYLEDFFGYPVVDRQHTHKMISPAVVRVDLRCAPPGELDTPAERGYILTHTITPVDEHSHRWRVFACCRAGEKWPADPKVSAVARVAEQFPGVIAQDLWALVEQQKMMDLPEDHYVGEMYLRSDTGILKAREIVREMVSQERTAEEPAAVAA
ncbi:Rieske 2Fe-2S domain-containing protein [Methylibium sp.]|uniref:Rieske 2Fe-2S domain-containing protein n=1 Tax=Methylibium sp. TaxID=2067992 RepID=UPI001809C047|nr:Rieske 2Fe-2S domain-containing protein [Methylibium sp.]MBA3588523.1 Rieske 2Fe-2S domain-containing protein [Methylibium sp.]